jgi:hypothetical protein
LLHQHVAGCCLITVHYFSKTKIILFTRETSTTRWHVVSIMRGAWICCITEPTTPLCRRERKGEERGCPRRRQEDICNLYLCCNLLGLIGVPWGLRGKATLNSPYRKERRKCTSFYNHKRCCLCSIASKQAKPPLVHDSCMSNRVKHPTLECI